MLIISCLSSDPSLHAASQTPGYQSKCFVDVCLWSAHPTQKKLLSFQRAQVIKHFHKDAIDPCWKLSYHEVSQDFSGKGERHSWREAPMAPHSSKHNKDNSCYTSWLLSPPHLPGLSWGAKIKACFYNIYHNHTERAVDHQQQDQQPSYGIRLPICKASRGNIHSHPAKNKYLLLAMQSDSSQHWRKRLYRKKKLTLVFAFLFNIAKTSR